MFSKRQQRALRAASRIGHAGRSGVAALDYVLVLGVVLPLIAFIMWIAPRMMERVYEMVCLLISWPWM